MASDRKQFERALANWDTLHDKEAYSVPTDIGRVAIICAFQYPQHGTKKYKYAIKDSRTFRKEAFRLAERIEDAEHRPVDVVINASSSDIITVLQDPMISDIITIGNGSFSALYVPPANPQDGFDTFSWEDVAAASDHLKTGYFEQRHCGSYNRQLSVPLGAFAMNDHRNVYAVLGMSFNPHGLNHPENDNIEQVAYTSRLNYEYIKQNFSYNCPDVGSENM